MAKVKETFRDAFTQADLIDATTVSCIASAWVKLGEYQVPAGEVVSVGFGQFSGQENAIGRIYSLLKDGESTPVEIAGKLRLSIYSPQDRPLMIISEMRTNIINANPTDRTKQLPFPEHPAWIQEDQKLVLEFLPDRTATLTKANCTIIMDCTKGVV